jgi:hypothetical protein
MIQPDHPDFLTPSGRGYRLKGPRNYAAEALRPVLTRWPARAIASTGLAEPVEGVELHVAGRGQAGGRRRPGSAPQGRPPRQSWRRRRRAGRAVPPAQLPQALCPIRRAPRRGQGGGRPGRGRPSRERDGGAPWAGGGALQARAPSPPRTRGPAPRAGRPQRPGNLPATGQTAPAPEGRCHGRPTRALRSQGLSTSPEPPEHPAATGPPATGGHGGYRRTRVREGP